LLYAAGNNITLETVNDTTGVFISLRCIVLEHIDLLPAEQHNVGPNVRNTKLTRMITSGMKLKDE